MTNIITSTVIDEANADEAYERVLPEAKAIPQENVFGINLDATSAIITGMAVAARLPSFLADLVELPKFPVDRVKKFPDYVLALFSAQSRYTFATSPPEQLPELLEKGSKWREILVADGRALVARGILSAEPMKELTGSHGYKNVAFDLSGLSRMFKTAWPVVEKNTGLRMEELIEVDKLALKLAAGVAHREQSPEQAAEATDMRQRNYTLFCTTYDEIRRGVSYWRWHEGDVDDFVPSLYAGRPNTNIAKRNHGEAKANAVAVAPVAAAPTTVKVPVGYPGSEPLSAV